MVGPRKVDKPLVLYGYGKLGHLAEEIFNRLKIPIYGIMDSKMPHLKILDGGAEHFRSDCLLAICVAREPYGPIRQYLAKAGWEDIVPVFDIIEAYPEIGIHSGWFKGRMTKREFDAVDYILSRWEDGWSWYHYLAFTIWHNEGHPELHFHPWCPVEYPSEPLPSALADIEARRNVWLWLDKPMPYPTSIHAEGKELENLERNIDVFKKRRPILNVACYHNRDGLWKIPKFLMDNLKDYEFKFRLHAYMGIGAYMYCTPKERIGK
jgi:hypothetical protein